MQAGGQLVYGGNGCFDPTIHEYTNETSKVPKPLAVCISRTKHVQVSIQFTVNGYRSDPTAAVLAHG